jgi:hypothetical protein
MGLMGLILKNFAALAGPPAYAMKGVVKQIERRKRPDGFVRRARIMQGQREVSQLSGTEGQEVEKKVMHAWHIMHELHTEIEKAQKHKGIAGLATKKQVKRELGGLFNNAESAERALAALKRGESLDAIIESERGRRKSEEKRKSDERRRSIDQTRSASARKSLDKAHGAGDGDAQKVGRTNKRDGRPDKIDEEGEDGGWDKPTEEKENPFEAPQLNKAAISA